ncbi:MAG: SH3 domain-containing protein [Pseudomonadota bacterium]
MAIAGLVLLGATGRGEVSAQATVPAQLGAPAPAQPPGGGGSDGLSPAGALRLGPVTKLPLPRYVSLRADEINVRRGPGLTYRMDWVFRREGLPVRIIGEHGDWRQIEDSDKASGWVYHSLLTGRRTVLVTAEVATLFRRPEADADVAAMAEQGVVAHLRECNRDWCEIDAGGAVGWVPKPVLWGVDPGELWPR